MRKYWLIALLFLPFIAASHARAESALTPVNLKRDLEFKGLYDLSYGGIVFGKLGVEIEQSSKHYDIVTDIITTGVVKFFVPHKSHSTTDATGADFTYNHIVYESNYQTRNKKKYVKIEVNDGKSVETLVPPDDRSKRPAVPEADKEKSADPLSFILRVREALHQAMQGGQNSFDVKFFDGRRLSLISITLAGKKTISYGNSQRETVRIAIKRKPIAGFTTSEIEDYSPKEAPLYAYFSNDEKLMPLMLDLNLWFGIVRATLAKECRTGESCLLSVKQ
jgi:hypothetical protein